MAQRTLHPRRLFKSWCSGAGAAQRGSGFVATLRVSVLLAAALLSACAAPQKKPPLEAWREYKVTGSVGLVVSLPVTPIKVRAADKDDAVRLELTAEKKRKEASMGVGATALTILTAPLAIFAPLYPPAIQLAALPFMAADATAKAGQDAERLQQEAAKARLDSACSEQLAAAHPALAENLQRALPGESLRQAIQDEVRDALQFRTHAPVVPIDAGRDEASLPDPFLSEARERHLPTVVKIVVQSLDLSGESTGDNSGSCRYKIMTSTYLVWWNVGSGLAVFTAPYDARLPLDSIDLSSLLDRPEELRLQLAKGFRDAVLTTLNSPRLKFPEPTSEP